ncbi:aldose epimerase family protein [Atopococcus tabaci]|uniref:aldose epimerase family protein n=1 Tax=Atopococcus tabaci TaxID=269774 RepID=UPI0024097354|nr:aldose epimerase family protein [Atopococcus tabaci]
MKVNTRVYGTIDETEVYEYTITNSAGVSLSAITYGATVTAVNVPDREGNSENVTLSLESLDDYVTHRPFYGATIGRVAGRIARGEFELDGKTYHLDANEGENQLHGGPDGLDTKIWEARIEMEEDAAAVIFACTSPDGDNGYPGNLDVEVRYTLTEANEWKIDYTAVTDKPTLFNPTNHVYFNLTGDVTKEVLNHELTLSCERVGELDAETLPTGGWIEVDGTPFDFREGGKVAACARLDHPQTQLVNGFDHPFLLDHTSDDPEVVLFDPESGRRLRMYTDRESVVIFTHNGEVDAYTIDGQPVRQYAGLTLETQTLPDAVHHDQFGDITLRPGETFRSQTIYQFDWLMTDEQA